MINMTNTGVFNFFFFIVLALLVPSLCVASATRKDGRAGARSFNLSADDELSNTGYYKYYHPNEVGPLAELALAPVLGIMLFCLFFGYIIAIVPPETLVKEADFLVLGHLSCNDCTPATAAANVTATTYCVIQSITAMCFAFIGWFVWTVSTIFSRMVTLEIVAATYYNILTRVVVAVFVAAMFVLVGNLLPNKYTGDFPDAAGFIVGFFPNTALIYITNGLRKWLFDRDPELEEFPLNLLQGITAFRLTRLYEMGIDDCVNLASANVVEIYLNSKLKLTEIADWIGQAQLVVLVGKDRFVKLQQAGYRTILDFHRGARTVSDTICGLTGFSATQLNDLATGLDFDAGYQLLQELDNTMLLTPPPAKP